jgi:hypothetical protein
MDCRAAIFAAVRLLGAKRSIFPASPEVGIHMRVHRNCN